MRTIHENRQVTTRKKHRCFACTRTFEAGSTMFVQVNFEDEIQSVYTCPTCHKLMDEYTATFIDDYEGYFPYGCVEEAMSQLRHEFKGETPEELLLHFQTLDQK